jgi:HD-GYP domain-containing protein (c-di-GMP phosphodiesterase class II)
MNAQKRELIHDFIRSFVPAVTHSHQYTTSHQQAAASIRTAHNQLLKAIDDDQILSLMMIDEKIIVHDERLDDSSYRKRFVSLFRNRGIQHASFIQGITLEELTSFIEMLTAQSKPSNGAVSFEHILFGKVEVTVKPDEQNNDDNQRNRSFEKIYAKELELVTDIYASVKRNSGLPISEIKNVVTDIISAVRHELSVLIAFSPLSVIDEYTFTHSTNVCILNIAQGMALGIKDDLLHELGVAGLLHDTGKIFVPEEILNKPGKLTEEEWEMIRQHPRKGAEYLVDNHGIPQLAVIVAYEHHMQYDFSGYPKVPHDWRQNICSQITTISDYFDALRTKRIYRDALENEIIAEHMMRLSGISFNPALANNFLFLMKRMFQEMEN